MVGNSTQRLASHREADSSKTQAYPISLSLSEIQTTKYYRKKGTRGWQDDRAGEGPHCQARWLKFHSWNPHGEWRAPTSTGYPLTSTHAQAATQNNK